MTSPALGDPARLDIPGTGARGGGRAPGLPGSPISPLALLGVTLVSLGGPLALAALYVPGIVADATGSAGLVTVGGAVVFGVPLLVWLRYSRHVAGPGGLYAFVDAAAGRRTALLQAGLWVTSYVLYLVDTTASIVYDTLPTVLPGVRPYRSLIEVALPAALAVVMLAGRTVTLAVTSLLAGSQMLLVGALAVVSVTHGGGASVAGTSLAATPAGAVGTATAQTALLYVCGSLPLFLGGEVARPTRVMPRTLVLGFALVAVGVVATVAPLAANPAFTRAPIPGMSLARVYAGPGLATAVGLGVAASTAGVMLVEYLALSRLLHAVTGRSVTSVIRVLAVVLVASGLVSLVDPERFYSALLKPSLITLWLSQLVVFAVYPRFATRHGGGRVVSLALAVGASAFAVYGMYATVQHAAT